MKEGSKLSGLATFSPPLPALGLNNQLPRILIGLLTVDDDVVAVAVDGEGRMELMMFSEFLVEWRYDPASETWTGPKTSNPGDLGDEENY